MEKREDLYPAFINCLLRTSYNCIYANEIKSRETGHKIDCVLEKLNSEECELLASYVLKAYIGGILETLTNLERLNEYANMKVRLRDIPIPSGTFEGIVSDYMEYYQKRTWLKENME